MASPRKKVAVIVDADNIPATYADIILEHAAKYGDILLKNAYCTVNHLKSWEKSNTQFRCIPTPSNSQSTDMTIAFVLGYLVGANPEIDTYCIATNDRHFRTLFQLLEPSKKHIYGFTLEKQGKSLRSGFSNFRILELPPEPEPEPAKPLQRFIDLLDKVLPQNEPIHVSQLMIKLKEVDPNFSCTDYTNSKRISKLLKLTPDFVKLTHKNQIATRKKS